MATDRSVRWAKPRPSPEAVFRTIREYFGRNATETDLTDSGATYVLGTQESHPRMPGPLADLSPRSILGRGRWIEVYFDSKGATVTTRMADDYAMAVADGLENLLSQFYAVRFAPK